MELNSNSAEWHIKYIESEVRVAVVDVRDPTVGLVSGPEFRL
jgi:hypothetical protein